MAGNPSHFSTTLGVIVLAILLGTSAKAESPASLIIDYPDEVCELDPPFAVTLQWQLAEDFSGRVDIRVESATGNLFRSAGDSGEATTGAWVRPEMSFFLVDTETGSVLAETAADLEHCDSDDQAAESSAESTVRPLEADSEPATEIAEPRAETRPESEPSARPPAIIEPLDHVQLAEGEYLRLSPPRLRYCGQPVERAMVRVLWDVGELDAERARIYLNSPGDQVFVDGAVSGEQITGEWVRDGTRFVLYLPEQDEVIAEREFRILPCNVVDYPDEPVED